MPTKDELQKSSDKLYKKFGLPTAAVGVDGVHIRIGKKPDAKDPALPDGVTPKVFWNRKNYYSLNVQIVGDGFGYIRDLDCRWPGSAHDSRVWETSQAKEIFEQQDDYSILGDGAYRISRCAPFTVQIGMRFAILLPCTVHIGYSARGGTTKKSAL